MIPNLHLDVVLHGRSNAASNLTPHTAQRPFTPEIASYMTQGNFFYPRFSLLAAAILAFATVPHPQLQAQVGLPQAPAAKKLVKDVQITFKGAVKLDENRIRSQMSTRVGQPFTDEAVERGVERRR